jgi:AcrR family transcriptional regulator
MNDGDGPVKSQPDGRRGRWVRHREERREELIDAAIRAIRRYGAEVGMDAVATEAGISKPVLYRYFSDKSQLWLAVGARTAAEVVAAVAPAISVIREERAMVAAAIDAYLAALEAEPALYWFVTHTATMPAGADLVAGATGTVASALARVIGDRLRALGLDAGPAEPWAYGLVGCAHAVGDWWLRHRQPISREALTEYLTTLLWSGIAGVRAAADLPGGLGVARD